MHSERRGVRRRRLADADRSRTWSRVPDGPGRRVTPRSPDGGHRGSDALRREPVELLVRLPGADRTPTAVHRTGRVKDESVRGIAVRVDRRIELVQLLGRDARQLETATVPMATDRPAQPEERS